MLTASLYFLIFSKTTQFNITTMLSSASGIHLADKLKNNPLIATIDLNVLNFIMIIFVLLKLNYSAKHTFQHFSYKFLTKIY